MKSIIALMGLLAVMGGATTPGVGPHTLSTDFVLKCASSTRYNMCTSGGRSTSCDYRGKLSTTDEEACGDIYCECVDYREQYSVSASFQAADMIEGQFLLGGVGHVFFKQGV